MAPAAVSKGTILRCPVCLARMSVGIGVIPQARLTCPSCRRPFERQEGLPLLEKTPAPASAPSAGVEASKPMRWTGHVAATAGGLAFTLWLGLHMKGPEFLKFYLGVWVVTFFGSMILKMFAWGQYAGIVGCILFEGLGVSRIYTGIQQGMHQFGYLFLMMLIGGFFYLARLGADSASGSGCPIGGCSSGSCGGFWSSGCSSWFSSSCSSSSSSSCGGGGCGGS